MSDGIRIQTLAIEVAVVNAEIIEFHGQLDQVRGRLAFASDSAVFERTELSLRRVIDQLEQRRDELLSALDEALAQDAPTGCTCGGMGVCTACVLRAIERESE